MRLGVRLGNDVLEFSSRADSVRLPGPQDLLTDATPGVHDALRAAKG